MSIWFVMGVIELQSNNLAHHELAVITKIPAKPTIKKIPIMNTPNPPSAIVD